jgi:hypothetical protein
MGPAISVKPRKTAAPADAGLRAESRTGHLDLVIASR